MWTNKFIVVSLFRVHESLFVGRLAWRDGVPSDYGGITRVEDSLCGTVMIEIHRWLVIYWRLVLFSAFFLSIF